MCSNTCRLGLRAMGTDFYFTANTTFRLTLDGIRGEGRVAPRLMLNFTGSRTSDQTQVTLDRMSAEVWLDSEMLGRGEMRQESMPLLLATSIQVMVPITRDVVRHVDEHARGDQLSLRVDLRARTTVQRAGEPETPWPGGESFAQGSALVPRASWVKDVVEPLGVETYVLLELPIPPAPERDRWAKSLDHIVMAERFYHEGNDPEVLQRCHAAFEALQGAPKAVFDREPDPAKRKQLDEALAAAKMFMHSGRHTSKTGELVGEFAVDHRDAAFALAEAKVWLSYIARLLRDSGTG